MSISEDEVRHVAMLARLGLTDEQVKTLASELSDILVQVERIRQLDLERVEPTTHAAEVKNVVRHDVITPCLPRESVLLNAPEQQDGAFRIPKLGG